jgi:hypothetical protein
MVLTVPRQTKARAKPRAGKRYPLNMRTTKAIRDKLERAAAAAGRSLAQEVELRLERSFLVQELMVDGLELAFGRQLAAVLLMLGGAMKITGETTSFHLTPALERRPNWLEVPYAFDQSVKAVNLLLEALRPLGKIKLPAAALREATPGTPPGLEPSQIYPRLGEVLACHLLREVATGNSVLSEVVYDSHRIHKMLGRALIDRIKQFGPLAEPENPK